MQTHDLEILIRQYSISDSAAIRLLFGSTWPATYAATLGTETTHAMLTELDETKLRSIMPQEDEVTLVAVHNEQIVGTLTYAVRHRISYLWGMYVFPDFQRRGVGSKLIHEAKQGSKLSDWIEVRVLQSSLGAVSFYQKHGFTFCGDETLDLPHGKTAATFVMSCAANLTK
jgi:ribosomal protein S18 acetylase RimI-like enzyme